MLWLPIVLSALCLVLLVVVLLRKPASAHEDVASLLKESNAGIAALLKENRQEVMQQLKENRQELTAAIGEFRKELSDSFKGMSQQQRESLDKLEQKFNSLTEKNDAQLEKVNQKLEEKLAQVQEQTRTENKLLKDSQEKSLKEFQERFDKNVQSFNDLQREKFGQMEHQQREMVDKTEKKLEEMRMTVDEKLHETLEKRLGESFKQVSERLEAVHKGLGDMQNLASSVGDLKKVMTNVKSRGVMGEYQLQNLLEDLLTNEQYERNVKTKVGSGAMVEFAIRMPNGTSLEKSLWLPIDSKFPKEDYELLVDAYDQGDPVRVEECRKAFVRGIRKSAAEIKEKYIDPPNTTEYGVMFLPYESLYAEVLRTPGLFEQLQRDYKITIAGPTTLSAFLNSLQMGFRTLAIEKRSSEVWDLLGAVKTEFGKFGEVLARTKKKLEEATNVIESAGVRSRAIERKLRNVETLSGEETIKLLGESDSLAEEQVSD